VIPTAAQLERRRLLARIQRRYTTVCQNIVVGSTPIEFHRIADPDSVLSRAAELESRHPPGQRPIHLPYWAQVWDSATALSDCLQGKHTIAPPIRPGESVLDLGCGMGLCGTAAAALGAGQVMMADREADALLFARLNALPFGDRACVRRVDWSVDRLGACFDRIVGADIIYDRVQWDELDEFWQAHTKEGGHVLLAEPNRSAADEFPQFAQIHGWKVDQETTRLIDAGRTIRLMRLARR